MSTPDELFVRYEGSTLIDTFLGKRAASDLFEYLHPKLLELNYEIGDAFAGEYYGDVLAITGVPQKYFSAVYALIMQACDELESLKPYREDLEQVLQSDSRYRADS